MLREVVRIWIRYQIILDVSLGSSVPRHALESEGIINNSEVPFYLKYFMKWRWNENAMQFYHSNHPYKSSVLFVRMMSVCTQAIPLQGEKENVIWMLYALWCWLLSPLPRICKQMPQLTGVNTTIIFTNT